MAKKVEPVRVTCSSEDCTNEGPSALTHPDSIDVLARTLATRRGWTHVVGSEDSAMICPDCTEKVRPEPEEPKPSKKRGGRAAKLRDLNRKLKKRGKT